MPIYQKLIDFDEMFYSLPDAPIIVNDLEDNCQEDKDLIKDTLLTKYTSDTVSLLPSCRCGKTKGEHSVGTKCDDCGTYIRSNIEENIMPLVWFRAPEGIDKVISPIVWIMLKDRFTKSGFNIMLWLTDTNYRPKLRKTDVLDRLVNSGIQRGYNNFVNNFDSIMEYLFHLPGFKLPKKATDYLQHLIYSRRESIFSEHIPLPNKSLLVVENTTTGVYVDPIIIDGIDAIQMLTNVEKILDGGVRSIENRTIRAINKLADFYETYFKEKLSPKPGQFRKHVYGSRTNHSARAVITSIVGEHRYNDIQIPWGMGITLYWQHLIGELMRSGLTSNAARGYLLSHIKKYDSRIDKMLQSFIVKSKDSLYVIAQRNPSLLQGSALLLKISKFKSDITDQTVSIPIEITKSLNADFDGDEMNIMLALDNIMASFWYALDPKFNILLLDEPDKISGNLVVSKPTIATVSNCLNSLE